MDVDRGRVTLDELANYNELIDAADENLYRARLAKRQEEDP